MRTVLDDLAYFFRLSQQLLATFTFFFENAGRTVVYGSFRPKLRQAAHKQHHQTLLLQ